MKFKLVMMGRFFGGGMLLSCWWRHAQRDLATFDFWTRVNFTGTCKKSNILETYNISSF